MAGIDKTYLNRWEDFDKIRNWALKTSFVLKNGQKIKLGEFLYYPNLTKEEWDEWHDERIKYAEEHYNTTEYIKECKSLYGEDWEFNPENYFDVVLWNTPVYVDIFLIRNCPFDFIQNRLKEQYGGGWSKTTFTNYNESTLYEQIKNGTSIYDTYERDGLGWNAKLKFHTVSGIDIRDKKCSYWIDINPYWIGNKRTKFEESYCYNEDTDSWYLSVEAMPWTSSNLFIKGWLSKKKIVRMIKKWNLPKGTIVKFEQIYQGKNGTYLVKEFFVSVS